jgi:hypothetical protein
MLAAMRCQGQKAKRRCGSPLASYDSEHAHTCSANQGLRILRHYDIVDAVLREKVWPPSGSRSGLTCLALLSASRDIKAQRDVLHVPDCQVSVDDVSVVPP